MPPSIEEALRSSAWRLVPVEATGAMLQAVITANRAETGLLIPIAFECAAGQMAYKAMLSASPDHTPALVALIEERDRLAKELAEIRDLSARYMEDTGQSYAYVGIRDYAAAEARALAAEAKCDALREALGAADAIRAAQRRYMADRGNEQLGKAVGAAVAVFDEIRARTITQETADV